MIGSRKPLGIDSAERIRPQMMQMGAMMQPPKIKKPFGSNGELGQLGALLLSASGNPAGQSLMQMQARREEAAREQQNYQRQLNDQWSMWERKEKWERENPAPRAPSEFDRQLDAAGITDPAERAAAYRDIVQNRREGSPFQFDVTGDGVPDIVPRSEYRRMTQGGAPAATDDDEWEYEGGPSPSGSATFP